MCLAAIAIGQNPRYPWVLLANRDEFFSRQAQAMAWWVPKDGGLPVLSGRDLSAGGAWLGVNEAGRLALLTNVREPGRVLAVSSSRGELVVRCLAGGHEFSSLQTMDTARYNGFNLLTADLAADPGASPHAPLARWLSNRPENQELAMGPGLYGLSNAALDTPWPKLQKLKSQLDHALQTSDDLQTLMDSGFAALADRAPAALTELPDTGLPRQREWQLSSAFIHIAGETAVHDYGTRCSTVLVVERQGLQRWLHVVERTFDRDAAVASEVRFTHQLPAQRS